MIRRLSFMLVLTMLLVACSSTPTTSNPTIPATPAPTTILATSVPTTAPSAFPVTITHKYGSTTIPSEPQRVIALGYTDQDPILALGVRPLAVRYWFGDPERRAWPWQTAAFGDTQPQVLTMPFGQLNLEAIAALKPDLIVAVSAGITEDEYARLSQIAPTLAQSNAYVDFGVPWQEQTRVIGQALGRAAASETLVVATEALRAGRERATGTRHACCAPSGRHLAGRGCQYNLTSGVRLD